MKMITRMDEAILHFFSDIERWHWVDEVMILATNLLPFSLVIFTLWMWFIRPSYRHQVIIALLGLLLSVVAVELLWKPLAMRPRPYLVYDWVTLVGKASKSYAFPSGHTSFAFALAVAWNLGSVTKGMRWLFVIAFLSAFTRLYLNVHYASDVFFGMIHGSLCAVASYLLFYSSVKGKKRIS